MNNDLGKKMMIRFKKSKDFGRTIMKLQLEGFNTIETYTANRRYLKVLKDGKEILYIVYEDMRDFEGIDPSMYTYKQQVLAYYY